MRVTPYEYCQQIESFLKGFVLHQSGHVNKAIIHYSQSLTQGGPWSNNRLRLRALECIELIIKEKNDIERL